MKPGWRWGWIGVPLLLGTLACNGFSLLGLGTSTPRPLPTIAPITPTPAATQPIAAQPARLAWADSDSLNLTAVTAEGVGITDHLTFADNGLPGASELAWAPQGQALAVATSGESPQLYTVDESADLATVSLLGPGHSPVWSPDGKTIVSQHNGNLWRTDIATNQSVALTQQPNWQWGNAVFAPDGQSVIVAGAPTDSLGLQGNTEFYLYDVPLDGSQPPQALPTLNDSPFFGRLPYDLQASPDGQHLAFSTSAHISACASPTTYYIGDINGSHWHEVASATVNAALDSAKEIYQEGLGLTWLPDSTAVVLDSFAWDCSSGSSTPAVGPLLSIVGLDGAERASLPLGLSNLSVDKSGQWLAGLSYQSDNTPAHVAIYSLLTGDIVADLGEGRAVTFEP